MFCVMTNVNSPAGRWKLPRVQCAGVEFREFVSLGLGWDPNPSKIMCMKNWVRVCIMRLFSTWEHFIDFTSKGYISTIINTAGCKAIHKFGKPF